MYVNSCKKSLVWPLSYYSRDSIFADQPEDATAEVYKYGSTSPASVLLDAVQQLESESPKADEDIQLIRPKLPDAVAICVEAAGQEYHGRWQKQLLKAASFGKSVLDVYSSDDFVSICETLRILNAVRDYRIGLPLTYEQYTRLTPVQLIQRLINRGEYLLAIRLSEFLRLPTNKIFVHWAARKARHSSADQESVCRSIVTRLSSKRGISFEMIARAAYDEGHSDLATGLLHHEARAGKQVPLLMSMSEDELALDKAIASGDPDLVFIVLLNLKKQLPLASFFRMLSNRPMAMALVETSARDQDTSLLKDLYYQDDRRLDGSRLLFSEALAQSAPQTKVDKLKLSSKLLADSTKDPAALLTSRLIQETQSLIKVQSSLDNDRPANSQTKFTGLSLNQTIYHLILGSQIKRANKLAADFNIPPKVSEWIRLRALVVARNWEELEDIARRNRKSPIGWEPYFNEVLGAGNIKLAGGTFVAKCTNLTVSERSEMWIKCGMFSRAGDELVKVKDLEGLENLKKRAGPEGAGEIERMMAGLRLKR